MRIPAIQWFKYRNHCDRGANFAGLPFLCDFFEKLGLVLFDKQHGFYKKSILKVNEIF